MTDLGELITPLPVGYFQPLTSALTADYVHVGQLMAATSCSWDEAIETYFSAVHDVQFMGE